MTALNSLFLTLLLSGCSGSKPVPAPVVVIPPAIDTELLTGTPVPPRPSPFSYGASVKWNASLLMALEQCNRDKNDARQQDLKRTEVYGRRPDSGG
ncbi:peptidase [Salmonella enterica subsp. enterica serovar Waycross]|nr:peptidase [Salmonella enterica]ECS8252153.1 peptidase [Salmonella enterica subsp. enterica serovar Waycross]EDV5018404.1 peptidase [Salmonella enterica subsp. enterica serovar Apapa]EAM3848360.1 peptidase [Salmonella enterica]EAP9090092.1 peptidase [Salmonella enterica]